MLRPADWLTFSRFALSIALWPAALIGQAQILGFGLMLAAVTDALDGRVARRAGEVSSRGARLDAAADMLLMLSAAAWLAILHPEIAKSVGTFLAAVAALYAVALAASVAVFRRAVDPRQLTAKAAGGLLYLFALVTFLAGAYLAWLLYLALAALAISSLETIFHATRTIQARAQKRSKRSQAPQTLNVVVSSGAATATRKNSAAPNSVEIRP